MATETDLRALIERAKKWLSNGGLFNPDLMARTNPDGTRDLVLGLLAALQASVPVAEPPKDWKCSTCGAVVRTARPWPAAYGHLHEWTSVSAAPLAVSGATQEPENDLRARIETLIASTPYVFGKSYMVRASDLRSALVASLESESGRCLNCDHTESHTYAGTAICRHANCTCSSDTRGVV